MKKVFGFLVLLGLSFTIASCNNKNNSPEEDGRYAIYKLAQDSNYKGTYEEWLASIKGDEIELSVIDNSLKWKYKTEPDTAYKTLVNLSTLKGADGKDGENGKDGKEVTDISSIKVGDRTIFTFTFSDNTLIKTELVDKKVTIRDVKSTAKDVNAYKAFKYFSETTSYDVELDQPEFQLGKVNFRFVENESLVPYVSLEEMSKLFDKYKKDGVNYKFNETDGISTWTIEVNNKEVLFKVDPINQQIMVNGGFENIYNPSTDRSKFSTSIGAKVTTDAINPNPVSYLSYEFTDFTTIKENGINYYPFGLLNTALGFYTGHRFFYNYYNVFEYDELSNLTQQEICDKKGDDTSYNIMGQMTEYISNNYKELDAAKQPKMPLYLRYNNRSEFIFEFENIYGLASTRNIKSMKTYFENYGIYDAMIDDNSAIRGKAYSEAAFILEDNHTGKLNTSATPWGEANGGAGIDFATASKLVDERRTFGSFLASERKKALKAANFKEDDKEAILYSADGKTAYFYFDSFDATNNAYNKDGRRKSLDDLAKEDSYFFFIKQLNAIKAHRTLVDGQEVKVKNVVIDDSQNGGGYVFILGKLLALISKDNKAVLYTQNELTKEISKSTFQVDSNEDGVYDANDCYGNDFDFYILTSNQSFSCGNALPSLIDQFKVDRNNHVKVIGDRSGGGECVVEQTLLSNGFYYCLSGTEHLINYNEETKVATGVEDGKAPAASLSFALYYNIEALNKLISEMNKDV